MKKDKDKDKNGKEKKKRFSFADFDLKHIANLLASKKAIDKVYDWIAQEAARIGVASKFSDPEAEFHLSDFPATQARIDSLIAKAAEKLQVIVANGNKQAWLLSNAKNNAMIDAMVATTGIPRETVEKWKAPNLKALEAFQKRDLGAGDMKLSDRVWQMTQQTKQELELALDIGLGEGKSAARLSRDVRKYLNEPNKLFRRVRDKHGNLRLSKAAEAYHPGQGVYRSSYKNALRLTATENNMAYREADHDKWQNLDMVIGQKIQLSNNHTLNGKPFHDICDEMQGEYPKDFKFVGWHPFCRCFVTPILASWEEQLKVMKMRKEGKDVSDYHYKGEITDMPQGYKDWMEKNADRISNAKSLPNFIKDNPEVAEKYTGKEGGMFGRGKNREKTIVTETNIQEGSIEDVPIIDMEVQRDNTNKFLKELGYSDIAIGSIKPMNIIDADMGKANATGDMNNCQLCAPTLLARIRGINITAKGYSDSDEFMKKLSEDMSLAFNNNPKKISYKAESKNSIKKQQDLLIKKIENLPNNSIHHFGFDKRTNGDDGHIYTIIKGNNKTYIIDGQEKRGKLHSLNGIIKQIDFTDKVEIMRVDNLDFSDDFIAFYKAMKREK